MDQATLSIVGIFLWPCLAIIGLISLITKRRSVLAPAILLTTAQAIIYTVLALQGGGLIDRIEVLVAIVTQFCFTMGMVGYKKN